MLWLLLVSVALQEHLMRDWLSLAGVPEFLKILKQKLNIKVLKHYQITQMTLTVLVIVGRYHLQACGQPDLTGWICAYPVAAGASKTRNWPIARKAWSKSWELMSTIWLVKGPKGSRKKMYPWSHHYEIGRQKGWQKALKKLSFVCGDDLSLISFNTHLCCTTNCSQSHYFSALCCCWEMVRGSITYWFTCNNWTYGVSGRIQSCRASGCSWCTTKKLILGHCEI